MLAYIDRLPKHSRMASDIVELNAALTGGNMSASQAKGQLEYLENSWRGSIGQFAGQRVTMFSSSAGIHDFESLHLGTYLLGSTWQCDKFAITGVLDDDLSVESVRVASRSWSRDYAGPLVIATLVSDAGEFHVPVSEPRSAWNGAFAELAP